MELGIINKRTKTKVIRFWSITIDTNKATNRSNQIHVTGTKLPRPQASLPFWDGAHWGEAKQTHAQVLSTVVPHAKVFQQVGDLVRVRLSDFNPDTFLEPSLPPLYHDQVDWEGGSWKKLGAAHNGLRTRFEKSYSYSISYSISSLIWGYREFNFVAHGKYTDLAVNYTLIVW